MPAIRHDDLLLRLVKEVNDIKAALRRTVANLPLYDIANENTPAQLTTIQNNYAPGNYDVLRLSSSRLVAITGIRAGVKGRSLKLFNDGSYSILITNEDTNSLGINRFSLQSGSDSIQAMNIKPKTNFDFYYDSTMQRWTTLIDPPEFHPEDEWTARDAPDSTNGICFSPDLNLYVAVGDGTCMTSVDGDNWTSRTISARAWKSVCWSSTLGIFVAVASNLSGADVIATSSNGTSWSAQSTPAFNGWRSVIWVSELNLFVCCGTSGAQPVMTSSNGSVWTLQTAPLGCYNVCWSPALSLLVAVSGGTNGVMTSSNGSLWTQGVISTNFWFDVVWSPEKALFVAMARAPYSTSIFASSPDGFNWTDIPSSFYELVAIEWCSDEGYFIAIGTGATAFSLDGSTWYFSKKASELIDVQMGYIYSGDVTVENLESTANLEVGMIFVAYGSPAENYIASISTGNIIATTLTNNFEGYTSIAFKKSKGINSVFTDVVYSSAQRKIVAVSESGNIKVATIP